MTTKNTLLTLGVAVAVVGSFMVFSNDNREEDPTLISSDDMEILEESEGGDDTDKAPVVAPKPKATVSKPVSSTQTSSASAPVRLFENGQYVTIVSLTYTGFEPKTVTIAAGESVRFVNRSGNAMRILSTTEYTGLSQEKSVGKGGTYELTFPKVGTWTFNNGKSSGYVGVVIVK